MSCDTDDQRKAFEDFCRETYITNKATSLTVTKAYVDAVLALLNQDEIGVWNFFGFTGTRLDDTNRSKLANFKHTIKKKGYGKMIVTSNANDEKNDREILVIPQKNTQNTGIYWLIVVAVEDFFTTIKNIHEATGHGGETVTEKKLRSQYALVPRSAIRKYIKLCFHCQTKAGRRNKAPRRVVIGQGLFERCQINLIDMQTKPSDGYCYIGHLMDHFSKFHFLFPLKQKTQAEVNDNLKTIFSIIGLPKLLHSDNDSEFGGMQHVLDEWPGSCDIVHGRPCHPQSQGLVERANKCVEEKLSAYEAQHSVEGPAPWHTWLPHIQYQLNTNYTQTIKMTPYECVFGMKPRMAEDPTSTGRILLSDDVEIRETIVKEQV